MDGVHRAGGAIFPQLWHQGTMRERDCGPFPDAPTISPSGIWGPIGGQATVSSRDIEALSVPSRPMRDEDIADVIAGFAASARHAMAAGFDGIAIHGAHGYLIDNFLWSGTNRRSDRWGDRSAFASELVKAVRTAIGDPPVIMFRFSQWKQQDVHARIADTPDDLAALLGPIADAGVDLFDASQRYFDTPAFAGSPLNLAGWAKKVTGKPSVTVGGVGLTVGSFDSTEARDAALAANLAKVAERLDRGEFDLVGVGRMLLHDPAWAAKLREGALPDYDDSSRMILS